MIKQLNYVEIQTAINSLRKNEGLIIPYECCPGTEENSHEIWTRDIWNNYQWNPPQFSEYTTPDNKASDKPGWEQLLEQFDVAEVEIARVFILLDLDETATVRISKVYHIKADQNPEKEWQVRLSGKDTSKEDAERIRLVKRHNEIKQRIENTTDIKTLDRIKNILDMDELWSAKTFPNTFPK